jgi:hypothetical protein
MVNVILQKLLQYYKIGYIMELVNAQLEAGTHSITFHRKGLANGIYIIKLKTNDGIKTSKMIIR